MNSLYDNSKRLVLSGPAGSVASASPSSGGPGKLMGIWRLGELIHSRPYAQLWAAQPADSVGSPRWNYVLKTIPRDLAGSNDREQRLAQLRRYAAAAASARHPHLVGVLDSAVEAAEPFLVMPRLAGRSLADISSSGAAQSLPVVLWYIRQVAAACAALHQAGFVHGDIHPKNVLVSSQGDATLIDLGRAVPSGQASGTDADASPTAERQESESSNATASDVSSLGRLLWQLLPLIDRDRTAAASMDAVADLITELVQPDLHQRPTAAQLTARLIQLETDTLGQHIRPHDRVRVRNAA